MPVYNSQNYLEESINSILSQTYTNFEFLIYDDNSRDNSKKIIKRFGQKDKRIIFFLSDKHIGYSKLLNMMIQKAKYQFLARMDSDDISRQNRFQKQLNFLIKNPNVSAVGSYIEIIDQNGNFIKNVQFPEKNFEIKKALQNYSALAHPATMIRAKFIKKIGCYRPNIEPAEDYDLWTRLVKISDLHNLPEYLLKFRQHSNSTSFRKAKNQFLKTEIVKYNYKLLISHNIDIIKNHKIKTLVKSSLIKKIINSKKFSNNYEYNSLQILLRKKKYIIFFLKLFFLFLKKPLFLIKKILIKYKSIF